MHTYMIPKFRRPTTPGETLREEFMEPLNITQDQLARAIGMDRPAVNAIVNDRRAITPNTAMRLAHVFGTTPMFWMNLQLFVDLFDASNAPEAAEIEELPVLVRA